MLQGSLGFGALCDAYDVEQGAGETVAVVGAVAVGGVSAGDVVGDFVEQDGFGCVAAEADLALTIVGVRSPAASLVDGDVTVFGEFGGEAF